MFLANEMSFEILIGVWSFGYLLLALVAMGFILADGPFRSEEQGHYIVAWVSLVASVISFGIWKLIM